MRPLNDYLGRKAKDIITNFHGTCTGFCVYLSGCNQVLLVPHVRDDGSYEDGRWFDQQRVQILSEEAVTLENGETPGFDKAAPVR